MNSKKQWVVFRKDVIARGYYIVTLCSTERLARIKARELASKEKYDSWDPTYFVSGLEAVVLDRTKEKQ